MAYGKKTCIVCGVVYTATNRTQRYCSIPCWWRETGQEPREKRKCLRCEAEYLPRYRGQKYCSRTCYHAANSGGANHNFKDGTRVSKGYRLVREPVREPGAYTAEHRLVMARKIGRELLPSEIVHHIDGNPLNNEPANLMLMADQKAHMREHRIYFADDHSKECSRCRRVKPRSGFPPRRTPGRDPNHAMCRMCATENMRERRAGEKAGTPPQTTRNGA